jgi:hypothetical protein
VVARGSRPRRGAVIDPARANAGLRRLAIGLLGYGAAGLVVAAIGLVVLLGAIGRIGSVGSGISADVDRLGSVLDRTATALDEAAGTARGFSGTVERTGPAVRQAAAAVRDIAPRLRDLETQANAIQILGSRPLASLAGLFGQIAGELDGLDIQLDAIADDLAANEAVLLTNATSLGDLAVEVRALRGRLSADAIGGGIDSAQSLLVALLALFVAWAAAPAIGALALGLWLRRMLEEPAGSAP